jgi:hypothetical protein
MSKNVKRWKDMHARESDNIDLLERWMLKSGAKLRSLISLPINPQNDQG